jgi:hypothetical protein
MPCLSSPWHQGREEARAEPAVKASLAQRGKEPTAATAPAGQRVLPALAAAQKGFRAPPRRRSAAAVICVCRQCESEQVVTVPVRGLGPDPGCGPVRGGPR